MPINISGIIRASGLNLSDGKIQSTNSFISTSFYEVLSSGTETIYPYDDIKQLLLTSGSAVTQTQSIFWINAGADGTGKMYLSDILEQRYTFISGSNITGSFELTKIYEPFLAKLNNSASADAVVYDISEYIYSGSRHFYNEVDFSNGKLRVYGRDLSSETNTASILLNVNGVGTYAIQIFGVTYYSNTSSILVTDASGSIISLTIDGVTDYNLGSITGGVFNTGDYFIFTPITSWSKSSHSIARLGVPGDPLIDASYYAYPEFIDDISNSGSKFVISGNFTGSLQPNTEINMSWGKSLVLKTEITGSNTIVTTNIYPYSNYDLKYYIPFSASIGYDSYTFGYGLSASTNQVVVGTYNLTESYDGRFIIGNGNHESNRSNLLVATKDSIIISGSITLSSSAPPPTAGGIYFDGTNFYLGF